ncbi:uncharacterized protein TNCV_5092061 [Trichonephila clavipes]|nr:uncharacterized protein TNCV_5092061 [Trichonephila clavipes]
MPIWKDHLLTTAISDYRTSVRNGDLSPPIQHNAFSNDNSRTTVMVSFRDVTGMKLCLGLSPNQLVLRIACGIETTLIRQEDTTPLMRCPVLYSASYTILNGAADG